jgi:taurine dioxygenase
VHPGQDDADVVRLAKDATAGGAENEWHADLTWHERPSFGAVLRAVEVPELGGDTLWADAGAAYDGLPSEVRERIDGMVAVHDWRNTFGLAMPPEDMAALHEQFPPVEHPIVRVHPETGRRTLFVNPFFTDHVVGLGPRESDDLLRRLYRQFTRPEFQCRFRWSPGSVAFWDNRACQHYASSDYAPQRRVMDRISIAGDRPFGLTAAPPG